MTTPYLPDQLFWHSARTPHAPAIATRSARLSYADLRDRVVALAGHLHLDGVRAGDSVLVALPSGPAAVVAGLAIQMLGGTSVEVNRDFGADALATILGSSGIRSVFIAQRDLAKWATLIGGRAVNHVWVTPVGGGATQIHGAIGAASVSYFLEDGRIDPEAGPHASPPAPALSGSDPALVFFTSGSAGHPRGVVQTHRNIAANTESIVAYLSLGSLDRACLTLPIHYCYGRSVVQTHLWVGASVYIDDRSAFPAVVLEALGVEGCTGFAGVPLTFELIRRQVDVEAMAFPRLRYLTQAGGPMSEETTAWVRSVFRPAELYVMYGQTEATARLSYLPPRRALDKAGSIGIAIPGVTLEVVDEAGRELAPGEVGELVAHGANITPGYLDDPEATAEILRDGWLWTGDLAYRDEDGFLFLKGRSKEIIKVGGHRVSPVEVEQVIARHPAVLDAAVIGVPDDLAGERPVAFVVVREGSSVRQIELQEFCRSSLPAHAIPATYTFLEELPRSSTGKLQRTELARMFEDSTSPITD